MGEEETSGCIVRVGIRVGKFVMQSMVPCPSVDGVLPHVIGFL